MDDNIKEARHSYYNYLRVLLKLNHIEHTAESLKKVEAKLCSLLKDLPKNSIICLKQRLKQLIQETIRNSSKKFYELLLEKHFQMKSFEPYGLSTYFTLEQSNEKIDNYGYQIHPEFSFSTWIAPVINYRSLYQNNKDIIGVLANIAKKYRLRTMNMHNVYLIWLDDYIYKENITKKVLMDDQGFLPKNWKIYLGIMAVSIMKNYYLLTVLENYFLENDGDESWLIHGLDILPKKLKLISKVNHILALCPWSLKKKHITELTNRIGEDVALSWNMNELMNAVLILIFYQKMAAVANSIGLGSNSNAKNTHPFTNTKDCDLFYSPKRFCKKYPIFKEELIKRLEEMEILHSPNIICKQNTLIQNMKPPLSLVIDDEFDSYSQEEIGDGNFNKHIKNSCFEFADFDLHNNNYISYFEFNWVDQGIYVLSDLFQSGIEYLNDEIDFIMALTNDSIGNKSEGNKELNTLPLRIAITSYIEKIFGITHEDYDYSKVNKLLPTEFKKFIKRVTSKSYSIEKQFIDFMELTFVKEEILHIILLSVSIKARVQLIYFARCMDEIMKNID